MKEILASLNVPPFFERFSLDERRRLVSLCTHREVVANETIAAQDAPTDGAYLIIDGSISLSRRNRHGQSFILAKLQTGDVFGELELLDSGKWLVTARAVQDTQVLHLPVEAFRQLLNNRDQLASKLLFSLSVLASQRLRDLDHQLLEALQDPSAFDPKGPAHTVSVSDEGSDASGRDLFHDLIAGLFTSHKRRQAK